MLLEKDAADNQKRTPEDNCANDGVGFNPGLNPPGNLPVPRFSEASPDGSPQIPRFLTSI
jgi:hypothetical protein